MQSVPSSTGPPSDMIQDPASPPCVTVVDYGVGNLASVANMIHKVGGTATSSRNPEVIAEARWVILPGVGAFDAGMSALNQGGLADAIAAAVNNGARVLGICLGFQLLFENSEEGRLPGLGLIPGRVRRFFFSAGTQRIPHMGWNVVRPTTDSALFSRASEEQRYYFVHSYFAECARQDHVTAECEYGFPFACAVQKSNLMGVQFHPEKSHRFGMNLLRRFLNA